jgi:hypothetical protein
MYTLANVPKLKKIRQIDTNGNPISFKHSPLLSGLKDITDYLYIDTEGNGRIVVGGQDYPYESGLILDQLNKKEWGFVLEGVYKCN